LRSATSNNDKNVECLILTGLKRPEAKAFCWLLKNKEGTSVEIERGADIRQPEVSLAMKCMKKRTEKAISDIEKKIKEEIDSIENSINRIKALLRS